MPPNRPLPKNVSFPELEERVLERWRERDVFRESMRRRQGGKPFVFYEGPPTANGRPGSHHVLARVFKDSNSVNRALRRLLPGRASKADGRRRKTGNGGRRAAS